jgi:hypothetical protein
MIATWIRQDIKKKRRAMKLKGEKVNEAFIGSWF